MPEPAAWERHAGVEEARREADARTDEQRRRECEERARRRRLADKHAGLSDEALAADEVARVSGTRSW